MAKRIEQYKTIIQPLWRNATSDHFNQPDGLYHAPTAPLEKPAGEFEGYRGGRAYWWELHSVQPFPTTGVPKLLAVWQLCSIADSLAEAAE